MKKAVFIVTIICLPVFIFEGCKKDESPKAVAKSFLTSFYHFDYDGAKKLSTDETKNFLSQVAQFATLQPDSVKQQFKRLEIVIKDFKQTEDKAEVTYVLKDPVKVNSVSISQVLRLAKKNEKWLVLFSKRELMGLSDGEAIKPTDSSPAATPEPALQDTLQQDKK